MRHVSGTGLTVRPRFFEDFTKGAVVEFGGITVTEPEIIDLGKALSPSWSHEDFPDWAASKRQVDPEALPAYATPWQAQIDRIDAPTLVIHGESKRGSLISADVAAEAVAINANIHTIEIAGAGHNVRRANYPDFLDAVRAFLIGP